MNPPYIKAGDNMDVKIVLSNSINCALFLLPLNLSCSVINPLKENKTFSMCSGENWNS